MTRLHRARAPRVDEAETRELWRTITQRLCGRRLNLISPAIDLIVPYPPVPVLFDIAAFAPEGWPDPCDDDLPF
jgi:hypothetical protein